MNKKRNVEQWLDIAKTYSTVESMAPPPSACPTCWRPESSRSATSAGLHGAFPDSARVTVLTRMWLYGTIDGRSSFGRKRALRRALACTSLLLGWAGHFGIGRRRGRVLQTMYCTG